MPYVGRDEHGNIITVSTVARADAAEFLPPQAEELQRHLAQWTPAESADDFSRSDQDIIRVVDDIIDTLIAKNLIRFTDLPEAAQNKLVHRRSLRRSLTALDLLGQDAGTESPVIKL